MSCSKDLRKGNNLLGTAVHISGRSDIGVVHVLWKVESSVVEAQPT